MLSDQKEASVKKTQAALLELHGNANTQQAKSLKIPTDHSEVKIQISNRAYSTWASDLSTRKGD